MIQTTGAGQCATRLGWSSRTRRREMPAYSMLRFQTVCCRKASVNRPVGRGRLSAAIPYPGASDGGREREAPCVAVRAVLRSVAVVPCPSQQFGKARGTDLAGLRVTAALVFPVGVVADPLVHAASPGGVFALVLGVVDGELPWGA